MGTPTISTEFICGLESQGLEELPVRVGTVALDAALDGAGTQSVKLSQSASQNSYARVRGFGSNGNSVDLSCAQLGISFPFRQDVLPESTLGREIFRVESVDGTRRAGITIDSAGNVYLINVSGMRNGPYGVYSAGSVMRFGFHIMDDGASTTVSIRINGGPVNTWGISNHGLITRCIIGRCTGLDATAYNLWYDSIIGRQGPMPPDVDVVMLLAAGNGYYNEWPTGDYASVDERPHDGNTTYIGADNVNERDTETLPDGSTLIQAQVWGVASWVLARHFVGFANALAVRLRSGTIDSDTDGASTSSSYAAYGRVYFTDPATGLAWPYDSIDGVEVGGVVTSMGTPGTDILRMTQVGLMIACHGGADPRPHVGAWSRRRRRLRAPRPGRAMVRRPGGVAEAPADPRQFAAALRRQRHRPRRRLAHRGARPVRPAIFVAPVAPPAPAPELEPQVGGVIRASAFLDESGQRRYVCAEAVDFNRRTAVVSQFIGDDAERVAQRAYQVEAPPAIKCTLFSAYIDRWGARRLRNTPSGACIGVVTVEDLRVIVPCFFEYTFPSTVPAVFLRGWGSYPDIEYELREITGRWGANIAASSCLSADSRRTLINGISTTSGAGSSGASIILNTFGWTHRELTLLRISINGDFATLAPMSMGIGGLVLAESWWADGSGLFEPCRAYSPNAESTGGYWQSEAIDIPIESTPPTRTINLRRYFPLRFVDPTGISSPIDVKVSDGPATPGRLPDTQSIADHQFVYIFKLPIHYGGYVPFVPPRNVLPCNCGTSRLGYAYAF